MINGTYDAETNTIYLRADATYNAAEVRGILGHTLAHEVTHSIKVWSEADYNVLTDFIRDALGADFDALVKDKMNKLNMGYTMASDEVIADGCEMLLRDSKALEKLAMENANLFVKVASKVREFVANLRKAQTDMYGGNEELHDAALKLREALKSLEEVQEVFDNALENSIRNMRDALAEAENAKTRENLDVLEKQAEKEGIKLSEEISERDAEYLKLAKDPKKNAAQLRKLVDEAAKAAGYTKRLYHGTQGFDSTRINTGYSDDGISFFMSDDERVTSWYSGTDEKKPIGKNISENGANNYEFYANTDNMYEIDDYGAQWDNILDADALDSEDAINKAFPESEGFTWDENDGFLNVYRDDVFYGEYVWDDESDRYVPNLPGRDPLPSRADGFGAGTTRSLSRAIYDSGKYSGVIFRKIHDAGFDNGNTYADIYNFFYPESQVKSADLVTYDDNGNIIPLSERFNTEMNELRFSEETADEFAENEKSAIEKALANMSVKDYNRRGWARTLLTREDASKLYSAVAKLFINKNRKEFRLKDGSYAVEVNNKIVFVSGTFENPRYESVLVFNTDNATDMEAIKDQFFRGTATKGLSQKDIERFIEQRRNYGQVYGFNAESFKATGKSDFGRAKLRSDTNAFGDTARLEVRDGIHTKVEGDVSLRVQGLKFSEETDSDSSAKTAAKLKKSKRQKGCRAAAFLLSLFDSLKPILPGFFGSGYGVKPHIYRSGCGARSPANIINQ